MDIGVTDVRAFLPRKAAKALGTPLTVGQVVPCIVTKSDSANITLTADPKRVEGHLAKNPSHLTIHNLVPGTRIKAKVASQDGVRQGVKMSIEGTDLPAYVHRDHFPSLDPDQSVPEGEVLVGEVLYVLPTVNAVYLTLKPPTNQADHFDNYKVG